MRYFNDYSFLFRDSSSGMNNMYSLLSEYNNIKSGTYAKVVKQYYAKAVEEKDSSEEKTTKKNNFEISLIIRQTSNTIFELFEESQRSSFPCLFHKSSVFLSEKMRKRNSFDDFWLCISFFFILFSSFFVPFSSSLF